MIRFCVFLLCLYAGLSTCACAQPPLVVVLLPGTSLQDWRAADAPALHHLMETGALAVMNTRTARLPNDHARETPESAVLTLGAGARAAGSRAALDFQPERTAGSLYTRRMGLSPLPGQSVDAEWPVLLHTNTRLGYQIRLGNLADALVARNVVVMAGGGPFAAAVTLTSAGTAERVSHLTAATGQCLVWDAGSNLIVADSLVAEAAALVTRQGGRLIVLSPFANDRDYSLGHRLTPVLEWGLGVPGGLLYSPSTHRLGLVTNTDFAPTVAAFFGLRRGDFPIRPFGDIWTAVPAVNEEQKLYILQSQAETQAQGMKLLPYLAIALGVWMVAGTALWFTKRLPPLWPVVPLVCLLAMLYSNGLAMFSAECAAGFFLVWTLGRRLLPSQIVFILPALIAASLVFDMLTGSRLMQRDLIGYSAIEGARYYGIGNEAMGALISALLVLAARLWKPRQGMQWAILLMLAMVSLLLGSANAGAKAGGMLVSLFAFGTLAYTLMGGRWSAPVVLTLVFGVVVIVAVAAIGDALLRPGIHSHLGEAVRRIQVGGLGEAGDIVTRKLAVEIRLAYHSAWALPLWGGLFCLVWLGKSEQEIRHEDVALKHAGLVAVAACVLLNDAGVVAGALCVVPLWCDRIADRQTRPSQRKKSVARTG